MTQVYPDFTKGEWLLVFGVKQKGRERHVTLIQFFRLDSSKAESAWVDWYDAKKWDHVIVCNNREALRREWVHKLPKWLKVPMELREGYE